MYFIDAINQVIVPMVPEVHQNCLKVEDIVDKNKQYWQYWVDSLYTLTEMCFVKTRHPQLRSTFLHIATII